MSFKAKIDGEVFELPDDYKKIMEYFSNAQAIDKTKNGEPVNLFYKIDLNHHHDQIYFYVIKKGL